ncbi:MAG TPA: PAS domain-containing protein [Kofleriaceae bacterium]|nr:PAS domain-containing protein [Kofleriaceae bacterium]
MWTGRAAGVSDGIEADELRAMLDDAPVGLLVIDDAARVVAATATACDLLAQSREAVIGSDLARWLATDDRGTFDRARTGVAGGGGEERVDLTLAASQVRTRWTLRRTGEHAIAVWIEPPSTREHADVSALRASEAALASRTAELRAIIDAFPDLYFWLDSNSRIVHYDAPTLAHLAMPPDQFLGKRPSEVFPPLLGEQLEQAGRDALRTGKHVAIEYSLDGAAGVQWFEARYAPVAGERVIVIVRNITERRHSAEAARQVDEQYRLVTDGVPVLISYVDRDERYRLVNRAYEKMFQLDRSNIIGRKIADILPRATYEAAVPQLRRVLAGEHVEFEATLPFPSGHREVTVSYVPHRDPSGAVLGFFALVADVTEHRLLEQQLRHSQKMEAIGRLAGGIAHDFNNLLMVITTSLDLARRGLRRGRDPGPELDDISNAASRAATLTRQLLAFSRRDAPQAQLLDFDISIQQTETMLRRLIGEDITLSVTLHSRGASVRIDPGHLEQVLMNLAVNARDAMPSGGTLSLETSREQLGDGEHDLAAGAYVKLSVEDTGVGMDAATRARIFEPFFTTKELDKGTGLGLATVYGIVAQSHGAIAVDTARGRGTRFDVYLPIVDGAQPQESHSAATRPPLRNGRVLLVEDEQLVRTVVRRALEEAHYVVVEAASGSEALSLVGRSRFDIIVTDMIMPRSTGRQVVERIRARHPNLPALFISGYPEQHMTGIRLDHQSIDAYLAKPFRIEDLLATMTRLLERAALERVAPES